MKVQELLNALAKGPGVQINMTETGVTVAKALSKRSLEIQRAVLEHADYMTQIEGRP